MKKKTYIICVLKKDCQRKSAKRSAVNAAEALAKCPMRWLSEKPEIVRVERIDDGRAVRLPKQEWPEWPATNA